MVGLHILSSSTNPSSSGFSNTKFCYKKFHSHLLEYIYAAQGSLLTMVCFYPKGLLAMFVSVW